jgi:DNA-binding PadR family transcriptional regulator
MVFKASMHRHHNIHHRSKRKRHYKAPFAERGWIQFLILRLLHETPIHGYQLIEEMESRGYVESGRFETGSIYVMLRRLERKGLLSSKNIQTESGRVRRVYTVTDKGEETLKKSLEYIINQKKIHDELADYYKDNFST